MIADKPIWISRSIVALMMMARHVLDERKNRCFVNLSEAEASQDGMPSNDLHLFFGQAPWRIEDVLRQLQFADVVELTGELMLQDIAIGNSKRGSNRA